MARGEVFQDKNAIMSPVYTIAGGSNSGLKTFGVSVGTEYNPTSNSYFRLEGRYLSSDND